MVGRRSLFVACATLAFFPTTRAFAGSYLSRASLLVNGAKRDADTLRKRMTDKELARVVQTVSKARVEVASRMEVPPSVAKAHPHLLLVLENVERAADAAMNDARRKSCAASSRSSAFSSRTDVAARLRLRAKPLERPFQIVLVEPEIPQNTGNIARLAAATASPLHLVGQLGFRIDEHAVRRAGLDYWHLVSLHQHVSFDHFRSAYPAGALHLFSATGTRSHVSANFQPGDALVFGRESVGLSEELLAQYEDRVVAIPTLGAVRSLNLANSVSIGLYEALRQVHALDDVALG
jgi:tRNA (cytidine/uridine-2'-O-)-methyltransferase